MSETLNKLKTNSRHFPWQRFAVCLISTSTIWFFLETHRNWVWSFFQSMMLISKPSPELAVVAGQAINSNTNVTILSITLVGAIAIFFITGNAALLASMFKFSSAAQSISNLTSAVESVNENQTETTDETIREFSTPELQQRYGDR